MTFTRTHEPFRDGRSVIAPRRKSALFAKRHYEFIARVLRDLTFDLSDNTHKRIVIEFSEAFLRDNPAFQAARFSDKSGVA